MSLPKPSGSVAPSHETFDDKSQAITFGEKLRKLGVDACKFSEVKEVSVGFTAKAGEQPLTNEELLSSLIQLAPNQKPSVTVENLYNNMVMKGQIKQPKCGSGR